MRSLFLLDPDVTFLNHGSFGACPKPIFADYQKWQELLERQPVQFITVDGPHYLNQSREALAEFIDCSPQELVFTTNPSYAINIIARSMDLKPGDEILTTDLEYGAMDKTWNYYCQKKGARYIQQEITLPLKSKEKFIEDFFKGLTSRTRAIFISQITSSTALVLPVKEICEVAKQKGLLTIVDGAHVPGQIPLNLKELKADIYTGACHKWLLTPKGCSFLFVKEELQDLFDPLLISWGFQSQAVFQSKFFDYHEMQGTRDISAFLTVPAALEFRRQYNWQRVSNESMTLVQKNSQRFAEILNSELLCPVGSEFMAQMCSVAVSTRDPAGLKKILYDQYKIEIPVMPHKDKVYMRFSINGYNDQKDLDKLFAALKEIKMKLLPDL